jgi:hypothetical protein
MRRRQRNWHIQRTGVPMATGQQRWDRAWQLLLQWAAAPPPAPAEVPEPLILPEMPHAHSDLRPRLDRPSGRAPDH